jgi:hypothetical protein
MSRPIFSTSMSCRQLHYRVYVILGRQMAFGQPGSPPSLLGHALHLAASGRENRGGVLWSLFPNNVF